MLTRLVALTGWDVVAMMSLLFVIIALTTHGLFALADRLGRDRLMRHRSGHHL
jgi:hypothetical protein